MAYFGGQGGIFQKCPRVPKLCIGSYLTKKEGFQPKKIRGHPYPRTMTYFGGEVGYFKINVGFQNKNRRIPILKNTPRLLQH
jgi:hypothetical protein